MHTADLFMDFFLPIPPQNVSCLCFVHCYYEGYGAILKYKIMCNQLIKPREFHSLNLETIHLLFCNNNIVPPSPFRHNHYVSLIFCSEKNKVNKKRVLVTSQKCKESKRQLTYSIHHFLKFNIV